MRKFLIDNYHVIISKIYKLPSNFFSVDFINELEKDIKKFSVYATYFRIQEINYMLFLFEKIIDKIKKCEIYLDSSLTEIINSSVEVLGDLVFEEKSESEMIYKLNKLRILIMNHEKFFENDKFFFISDNIVLSKISEIEFIKNEIFMLRNAGLFNMERMLEKLNSISKILEYIKVFGFNKNFNKIKSYMESVTVKRNFVSVKELYYLSYIENNLKDIIEYLKKELESKSKISETVEIKIKDLEWLSENLEKNSKAKAFLDSLYLVSLKDIAESFRSTIYSIADATKKSIELVVKNDMSIYKKYSDKIKAVFLHIIRNSCDHGIESPEERILKNKNKTGTIRFDFEKTDTLFVIRISDDGRGIDIDKISKKVIEKNLATKEELNEMSSNEIINFIFYPNFSTSENVSEISGRGVGMDAVKKYLDEINGKIKVKTEKDQFTIFEITILR